MLDTDGPEVGEARRSAVRTGQTVRHSLALSFAGHYVSVLIQLVTTAILARLLTPEDYGIYTVGLVIISIMQVLRDFGVISFVMQERVLTKAAVQTAYGVSLLIGCVAAALAAASSGAIADFYQNEGVGEVLLVLSANFLLMPFGSIVLALLRREMSFATLLWINTGSIAINSSVAVLLGFLGFGFMSMAWGSLAGTTTTCVLAAAIRPEHFKLRPSLKDWRRVTSFGAVASAGILVSEIGLRAPDLVIGRSLGVQDLGLYGRGSSVITMFDRMVTTSVAPVANAAIALRHRNRAHIRDDFLKAVTLMTVLAWPFYAFLGLMAFPVTRILFGGGWDDAIPIARLLCVAGAVTALGNLNWHVFQGTGNVRRNLNAQLVIQPITIALVLAAAQHSLLLVGVAVIISSCVSVVVTYHFLSRLIGVALGHVLAATATSLGVAALSAIAPLLVLLSDTMQPGHFLVPFGLAGLGGGFGFLIGIRLFRHPLYPELTRTLVSLHRWLTLRLLPPRSA